MGILKFTWDPVKDKKNIITHGVSFSDASSVFDDPMQISVLDRRFDYFEERWITLGTTRKGLLLVVGHLYLIEPATGNETIRIITARRATAKERSAYETTDRKKRK
jgi:uncharacterized protein